jgi:hypothetical protein
LSILLYNIIEHLRVMQKKGCNYLLAKTGVGEVRKGFHELPPAGHAYGRGLAKDREGAREGTR